MTVREQILAAWFARMTAALEGVAGAILTITRNATAAERMDAPEQAWADLVDGSPAAPPVGVMGGRWEHTHLARVRLSVGGATPAERDATFDLCVAALDAAATDELLGGLADLVEVQGVEEPDPEAIDFSVGLKTGEIPILFLYSAPSAAG